MELDDIKVSLKEEIQDSATVVIGVELLYNVDQWFGTSKEVGKISAEKVYFMYTLQPSNHIQNNEKFSLSIHYHSKDKIYTVGILHQPPLPAIPLFAHKIIDTLHPKNLVILTSSTSVPSTIPISFLQTSTKLEAIGGIRADPNPLFSNRGRVTGQDIQSRIHASQHPEETSEIPLLRPPNMIQGIAASLMSLAEVHGIHATCFVFSSWVGEGLEKRDVEKVVGKVQDCLGGVQVNVQDVLKGWKHALGVSGVGKSSIYL